MVLHWIASRRSVPIIKNPKLPEAGILEKCYLYLNSRSSVIYWTILSYKISLNPYWLVSKEINIITETLQFHEIGFNEGFYVNLSTHDSVIYRLIFRNYKIALVLDWLVFKTSILITKGFKLSRNWYFEGFCFSFEQT